MGQLDVLSIKEVIVVYMMEKESFALPFALGYKRAIKNKL